MKCNIIDFTLLELLDCNNEISSQDIVQMAKYISQIGADAIFVNDTLVNLLNDTDIKLCFINLSDDFLEIELEQLEEQQINSISEMAACENFKAVILKGLDKCLPWCIGASVAKLKNRINLPIILFPNDTRGMGTANAIEGAKAGADFIVTCFNGKGRYKSYAALEEVIMSLNLLSKYDKPMDMHNLQRMLELYQWYSGKNISALKPILGRDIFKCESGIHGDGILKDKSTYEPYPPEILGRKTELICGKHSGKAMVLEKLRTMNINCSDIEAVAVLDSIKKLKSKHTWVDDKILKELFFKLHKSA